MPPSGLVKALFNTDVNHPYTAGQEVAIGEIVEYQVTIVIPAGSSLDNATMTDTMDLGLSFVACQSITGPGLTTSVGTLSDVCDNPVVDDGSGGTDFTDPDYGRRVVFDFGTLTNPSQSDVDLVITYDVVVLNNALNVNGLALDNSALFEWEDGHLGPQGTTVDLVEPRLQITKLSPQTLIGSGAGQIVDYTVTVTHSGASAAAAFDVVITDAIPLEFDFVGGSLNCSTAVGSTNNPTAPVPVVLPPTAGNNGTITAGWHVFLTDGRCRVQVQADDKRQHGHEPGAERGGRGLGEPGDRPGPGNENNNAYSTERRYDPNDPENINTYFASSAYPITPLTGPASRNGVVAAAIAPLSKNPSVPRVILFL